MTSRAAEDRARIAELEAALQTAQETAAAANIAKDAEIAALRAAADSARDSAPEVVDPLVATVDTHAPVIEAVSIATEYTIPPPARPQSYSGRSTDGMVVTMWLFMMEQRFATCRLPREYWLSQACSTLEGMAMTWWVRRVQSGTTDTYDTFRAALISQFTPPNLVRSLRDKIAACCQGDQSVLEYAEMFQNLLLQLPRDEMGAADQFDRFYRGLHTELRTEVLKAGVSTLAEAISQHSTPVPTRRGTLPQSRRTTTTSTTTTTTLCDRRLTLA